MPDPQLPIPATQEEQDPGSELVADISSRIQAQFPNLEHSPEIIQTIETVVQARSFLFAGPSPPPHLLAQYERICPGWGARLLEQGEREQLWRMEKGREELSQSRLIIEAEKTDRQAGRKIEGRGLLLGFVAFLLIAAIGVIALLLHETAVAITCFTTFVLGVVGLFVTRSSKKRDSV